MRVKFHPAARAELREARRWYYERSPLSATAFAHVVDDAVAGIGKSPTQYPLAEHRTRKLVLQRFPFNIFYLSDSEVVIVAVAHQKRRPGYWSSRL
ncbi:MAG: type II toxin-antitoxin system RelE/ParE family toxin [bacterium]